MVIDSLPLIGKHSTFGCELEFVSTRTQKILADPVWDTLHECNCFNLVVRRCFEQAEYKGQLRQIAKALLLCFHSTADSQISPWRKAKCHVLPLDAVAVWSQF